MDSKKPIRVCVMTTHSFTIATLCKGILLDLSRKGFEVTIVVGDDEYTNLPKEHFGDLVPVIIPMKRLPSPWADLKSLLGLTAFFLRNRFDIVHISTPKASLLGSIAARLTFNGKVMFVYRRCIYELKTGMARKAYLLVDKLICALSDVVLPISRQIEGFLVADGVCPPAKIRMIGEGSSNGVDTIHFSPTAERMAAGAALRQEFGIPAEAPVVLFLGRLCSEKGVDLIPPIFRQVKAAHPDAHLVVVGPHDVRDPISADSRAFFETEPSVHMCGFAQETAPYYAMATVFLFPSYFEGFGNVLLEAASLEVPSVAFRVPGVEEAVADGVSGILVEKGDVDGAAAAINRFLAEPGWHRQIGRQARQRAVESFERTRIWAAIEDVMHKLAGR